MYLNFEFVILQAAIPVKPPVDMTAAIRRQSRTQGVDYSLIKKHPSSHVVLNRHFVLSHGRDTTVGKEGQIINYENNHSHSNGDKEDIPSHSDSISVVGVTNRSVQTSPRLFKDSRHVFHNENINIPTGLASQDGQYHIPRNSTNSSKALQRKLPRLSLTHGERISPVLSYQNTPSRPSNLNPSRHISMVENANQSVLNIEDKGINQRSPEQIQNIDDVEAENLSQKLNESPLHFAEQILKASDLRHMSRLCSEKVPYAEFIEQVEPHRLGYLQTKAVSVNQSKPAVNQSSQSQAHSNKQTKIRSVHSKKHLSFPNAQDLSKGDSSVSFSEILKDDISTDARISGKPPFSYVLTKDPIQLPEIDYDKPITIIVEANHSPTKLSKPILKTRDNEVRTEPRATTSSYSSPVRPASEDKARLVRFHVHPKVHEFAPSEPVKPRTLE